MTRNFQKKNKLLPYKGRLCFAVNEIAYRYFVESLRTEMSDEVRYARDYAYTRWPEDFCATSGIGYAHRNGNAFIEQCQKKGLSTEDIMETGLIRKGEDGLNYASFRERIMIPIKDRWGRVIAFTGRYIGSNSNPHKYINSPNSAIYSKGNSIFGIDKTSRYKASNIIVVEGAPDVLKLQCVGLENSVATLGTAWSDSQLDQLKKFTTPFALSRFRHNGRKTFRTWL